MALKRINHKNQIKVILWGVEIGTLTWLEDRKMSYFFFSDDYFHQPYDICPLSYPKNDNSARQAIYGPSLKDPDPFTKIYQGLPPFLADSLPDKWGNIVFDRWFTSKGYPEGAKTPITKLSFIGNRAMGAFEFKPMMTPHFYKDKLIDIQELYNESLEIEKELSQKSILRGEETINNIAALGTSPGGGKSKAIISMAPDGSIHSGMTSTNPNWKHYIIKFNNKLYSFAETEYTYWQMAKEAGICMMPAELKEIESVRHFLTERFDRKNGNKIMMQTLAAINPSANSYEELFSTCRKLDIPSNEITRLYRQTVFNFIMNNTDDHTKNFSFMMDEKYKWHLTPAYDLTFIISNNVNTPETVHCLSLNGKYVNITDKELIEFGKNNDISKPEAIVKQIREVSMTFEEKAKRNGVNGFVMEMISKRLNELGRTPNTINKPLTVKVGSSQLKNIHFEMSSKENIHLCATVGDQDRKIVITPKKALYKKIIENGFNLMDKKLKKDIFKEAYSKQLNNEITPG